MGGVRPPAPHELNPRVEGRLSALCLRMLSVRPEARGTAEQMAEALEQVAHGAVSSSRQPLFTPEPMHPQVSAPAPKLAEEKTQVLEEPPGVGGAAGPVNSRASARPWQQGAVTVMAVLMLAGRAWWAVEGQSEQKHSMARHEAGGASQEDDEDTTGLGEAASPASVQTFPAPSAREVLAEEPLPEPVHISINLTLNDETRGFLDKARIARMKPGMIFVNTARGALVDEAALIEALKSGHIRHAGLDVFHNEPLKAGDPMARLENVTLSAHAAFRTLEASMTLLQRAIDIVKRVQS